ncbi:MAG: topoisomerase DNA-binding C4 zinc finger domain-containing protein, partial [Desulfovibrio sp.]|jgi:DNA topoisomerase-1|nr:topoisomerase DNA-binding C4 zinc finger domain-containing protein [Desulfovibrio sp.]
VDALEIKEREKSPPPPFTTSTLQQAANQRLNFTAKRTMNIAQRLYEGVDLGQSGTTALITYMRTDSVRISDEARTAAQEYIIKTHGKNYYPAKARYFKSKGGAQDAHEAIRPVDVRITPDEIKAQLPPEQYRLYNLIWTRFMASQAAGARVEDTVVLASRAGAQFRAKGERLLFPGFYVFSPQKSEDSVDLPKLSIGAQLKLLKLEKEQKFTQPSPLYSEASLVKELEEKGIGRPSTYAGIIATLQDREYAALEDKHFVVTDLGRVVCDMLTENFEELMDVGFTAQMEAKLDKVADGGEDWVKLLGNFSAAFNPTLEKASQNISSVKSGLPSGIPCPKCGKATSVKFGKSGPFLACSDYPACKFTSNFTRDANGEVQIVAREQQKQEVVGKCPDCGGDLVIKNARTGSRFIACANYPTCRHAESFSTGVYCPVCAEGMLAEKSSRRGKIFYSCDQYPKCSFAMWDPPRAGVCPQCGCKVLGQKKLRGRSYLACPQKGCGFKEALDNSD